MNVDENERMSFEELNQEDKDNFIDVATQIFIVENDKIKNICSSFIEEDARFREIQDRLLSRKTLFVKQYSSEIEAMIE